MFESLRATDERNAEVGVDATGQPVSNAGRGEHRVSDRVALWAFVAYVAISVPVILFHIGSYHWFFGDEWSFLGDRDGGSLHDLFASHGEHWTTVPVVVYRVLFRLFHLDSYRPYQVVVVIAHATTALLLRAIARRGGARPWTATIVVAVFVLYGPGEQNIVWAFQMTFVGAILLGLVHLLLADHDGPFGRRDLAGVGAGLLGLMCSGVALVMVAVVGLAVFARRGWRMAAYHTAPLAAAYCIWYAATAPGGIENSYGRGPTARELARFTWSGVSGLFESLGGIDALGVAVAVIMAGGIWVALRARRPAERRQLVAPLALVAGVPLYLIGTGWTRWFLTPDAGAQSRYLYTMAAFVLPALAIAVDALALQWRLLAPLLLGLFVFAAVANVDDFGSSFFTDAQTHERERSFMTALAASEAARDAPGYLRPRNWVTIGWLRERSRTGELPRPTDVTPFLERAVENSLAIGQIADDERERTHCDRIARAKVFSVERGERFTIRFDAPPSGEPNYFTQDMVVIERLNPEGGVLGTLRFKTEFGDVIEIEVPEARIRVSAGDRSHHVVLCA